MSCPPLLVSETSVDTPPTWSFDPSTGWDLTHSSSPRLTLKTTTAPITINPTKTALIVIDMQNFFLSPVLGHTDGPGHAAYRTLVSTAFPAARRAKMRIIHLTWGIDGSSLAALPPVLFRGFGFTHTPRGDGTWLETPKSVTLGGDMGRISFADKNHRGWEDVDGGRMEH